MFPPPRRIAPAVSRLAAGVLTACALALPPGPPTTSAAASPPLSLRAAGPAELEERARGAAARVEELAEEYRFRSRAVAAGVAALAESFAATARAEREESDAGERLARARRGQARAARAVYVQGGPMGLAASVLGADSPDTAMWRLTTTRRLMSRVLEDEAAEVRTARARADAAARAHRAAAAADLARVRALARLRTDSAAAAAALDEARRLLADLDGRARRSREAEEAARHLAQARRAARAADGVDVTALAIPADFAAAYVAAAGACPGLRWSLLAAVGQVESGHGRNNGPSSAGAVGPMQFMPATFAAYGVDGDGDGRADPWDPEDAVFSAAAYLCADGPLTSDDAVRAALFRYNHAGWYVDLVLAAEQAVVREGGPD